MQIAESTTKTLRLLGRCKKCKSGHRTEGALEARTETHAGKGLATGKTFTEISYWIGTARVNATFGEVRQYLVCGCGGYVTLEPVRAKESKHECGAKCLSATGPACECACRGENHGRGV